MKRTNIFYWVFTGLFNPNVRIGFCHRKLLYRLLQFTTVMQQKGATL